MAWDHPRARNPLEAVSARWSASFGEKVHWDARPLKAFEDQPLEQLATSYDLVLIDHPFVGTASRSGLIVPVDRWVDAAYLDDQARHSVGPSFASYRWAGGQWALALDAACQVSAVRTDLPAAQSGALLPRTWKEVAVLARALRDAPARVALPLNPNHAYCAFLSVGVAAIGSEFWPIGARVHREAATDALQYLKNLAADVHPLSRSADPIAVSDRMTGTDEILYVPLMFGYSNYARPGFRARMISFGNAPQGGSGHIGSVLGGVGIALSAQSRMPDAAADLARTLVSPEVQTGLYVESGGQPGHAAAWDSAAANKLVSNFFTATRLTIEHAYVRPRVPGHRRFQELAGELIHNFVWGTDVDAKTCLAEFDALTAQLLGDWHEETASP